VLSQFGIEASRAAQYVIAFAIILVLVALFGLVLRKLTGGRLMMNGQDRSRARQPRLGVVDIYDLDRQRQLVLLRRDNVEHLLLIGGLNDVVIETNIVRVAGARIPAPEQGTERFEPAFEPTRPQVETPARPSIETQLAAQLGSFMRRPSDDTADEVAPQGPPTGAPESPRLEPVFKSEAPSIAAPPVDGSRSEPAAPTVRPEPRPSYMPPMFQSRPTPTPAPAAPPMPAPPPPAPPAFPAEPVRATDEAPAERGAPDAAILSDMAKQLEEALKRPATPLSPRDERAEIASAAIEDNPDLGSDDDDDLLEPATVSDNAREVGTPVIHSEDDEEDRQAALVETDESEREPKPVAESPPAPAHRPEAPAPAKPAEKVADPFSVEEIEAEFARLLGRPLDTGKKG
jgi:flagellar protein FliO/FliZ